MIKTKNIISFALGGLISLTIISVIIGTVGFLWLLHIGYEPILESIDYLKIYGFLIICGFLLLIAYKLINKKRPIFSRGLLLGYIPIIIILTLNSIDYYDFFTPDKFDKNTWIQSNPKPYEMSRYIIRKELTKDLTKEKALELLGNDYIMEHSNDSTIVYQLDISRVAYLMIRFDKNGITKGANYVYYD